MQPKAATPTAVPKREAARPGELDARYARLFERLQRPAKGMVRRAFGSAFSDDELDDLYSGAWLSTLAALDRRPRELSDEELRRYVLTAVAHQASRELRRRGRKPTLPMESAMGMPDPEVGPDEAATKTEQTQVTREVLGSLPPRRRAVMVFRYGWGLEPSEVCGIVGDLSPRTYRKEVERGVAEVVRKMRMVEDGEWCGSREPLLRAVAAGTADEDEERQARQHLAHCRACTAFLNKLGGHLHDLGSPLALTGAAESLHPGGLSVFGRVGEAFGRAKHEIESLLTRASDGTDQAAGQVISAGGGHGAGAAGAGAAAKLAGLGAVPKLVAACVGTGVAATACVAAGVVPGTSADHESPTRPAVAARAAARDRTDLRRHALLAAINAPSADDPGHGPADAGAGEGPPPPPTQPSPPSDLAESAPPPPPPTAPTAPAPQDFEPVGTPVQASSSPSRSTPPSGSGPPSATGGDFGP